MRNCYDDVGIIALFDVADERLVEKEILKIQDHRIPPNLDQKLSRVYQDQTVRFEDSERLFEPVIVSKPKHDLVTYAGQARIAQLVCGKSSQYFTYFAAGTGVSPERPRDSILSAEIYRVSMVTDGYAEASGTVMRFAGKFPSFVPTSTISEAAVFDSAETNTGCMFFRTLYPAESRLPHVQGRTFFVLTQSIAQISVT
jgi:hypothetical protein